MSEDIFSPEMELKFYRAMGPPTAQYPDGCMCWLLDRQYARRNRVDGEERYFLVGPGRFAHKGMCPVHHEFHRRNVRNEWAFIGTLLFGMLWILVTGIGVWIQGGWPWGAGIIIGYAIVFIGGSIVSSRCPHIDVPKDVTW